MDSKKTGRRRFLQGSAAVVGMALGGLQAAKGQQPSHQDTLNPADVRPLGERSPYEKPYRVGSPTQGLTPLQDSYGIITPSDLHFYVNHEYGVIPVIDPKKYRLVIHGMVKRSVILTLDEIKLLPSVTRVYFIECNGNASLTRRSGAKTLQDSHGRTSCAEWTGVPLSLFLKEVGVQAEGSWVLAVSQDTANHAISIPMEKCMDDVLVAYAQNGEPMRLEQGYPLRLVVPGWGRPHSCQVAESAQGGGSALPDHAGPGFAPGAYSGRRGSLLCAVGRVPQAPLRDGYQVRHHFPFWGTAAARQGSLPDNRAGLVRGGQGSQSGSLHR